LPGMPSFDKNAKVWNAFKYFAPTIWNSLSPSIRSITSLSKFKSYLSTLY